MILNILLALLGFATSIWGVVSLLTGLVIFLALPVVPAVTGRMKQLADLHLWFATWCVGRAAIVVTEHDEILFKSMSFSDIGVEEISFDDETKSFEDPAFALHYWKGIPFALADEVHGLLFDPRHAAVGARKREHERQNSMVWQATEGERDMYDVLGWARGVFEFPEGTHELVNLSAIRELVTGNERAEHPSRAEEFYKLSREPYQNAKSAVRAALILVALVGPFAAMWLLANQGGGAAGGGTTVGFGTLWLLMASTAAGRFGDTDWKEVATLLGVVLPLPLVYGLLFIFVNPLLAIGSALMLAAGFLMLPAFTFVFRNIGPVGGGLARYIYLKLGLLGYDRPVFEWTPESYRLREADDLEHDADVNWYGLSGSLVGFTFDPSAESWETGTWDADDIRPRLVDDLEPALEGGAARGDGGAISTNLPVGLARFPEIRRAHLAAAVPKTSDLEDAAYYVDTGIWFEMLTGAAVGEKTLERVLAAKEKHGGQSAMSDTRLMQYTIAAGAVSFIAGLVVFFL